MNQTSSPIDYVKLFQSLPTVFIVFRADDPVFTIIEENKSHAKMANVKRSSSIGRPLLEVFPDVSKEYLKIGKSQLLESIRRVIKTGKSDAIPKLHYDIKDRDGIMRPRYWSVTHYPIFEDGEVVAIYQATEDTTAENLAHKNSKITKNQLKQILKSGNVGTWVWNIADKTIAGDKKMATLFGLDAAAVETGLPIEAYSAAVHPDDQARVIKEFQDAVTRLRPYECEYRTLDASGDVHWVITRGYFEKSRGDEISQSPGIIIDITERKRTEENLNFLTDATTHFSASLGYKEILRSITKMVVPKIADWCTIELLENGALQQVALAHRDPKKVEWAKDLRRKKGPPSLDEPSGVPNVIRTGEAEYYPDITQEMLEAAAKNEEELKMLLELGCSSVIIAPLTIEGKTIGALTFVATESRVRYKSADLEVAKALANRAALAVHNATLYNDVKRELEERRQLQRDLQKLSYELEYRTRDEFISLASHQLRTPATGVKQYVGMVLEGFAGDITAQQRDLLNKAYESNDRQLRIVSDLLKVAQVDAGRVLLRKAKTDMGALIGDVIREQFKTFKARQQTVHFPPPRSSVIVLIDQNQIRMVIENMLDNASKYSEHGKTIDLKLAKTPTSVTITIKDQGVGIAYVDQDKLFTKFSRIHNSLSTRVGGTGLGLYWAQKIVALHGGSIGVESIESKGTTFVIHLPKTQ